MSQSFFSRIVVKKLVKMATENPHVNPIDLPVTLDPDPKSPANQHGLAIRLFDFVRVCCLALSSLPLLSSPMYSPHFCTVM